MVLIHMKECCLVARHDNCEQNQNAPQAEASRKLASPTHFLSVRLVRSIRAQLVGIYRRGLGDHADQG